MSSSSIHQQMSPIEIATLLFLSLLWGGSFFFVEILVDYLPPLTIVTVRVALAAVLLWVIVIARRVQRPRSLQEWGSLFVVGLFNSALPFLLITWGQTRIDSGLASILNATTPLFVVILAGIFLADEKMSAGKLIGVLTGIGGVAVLIGPDALRGVGGSLLGQVAVMTAALSYGVSVVFSRRFSRQGIPPLMVATGQVTTATLLLLPLAIYFDGAAILSPLPFTALSSLLSLALFSTVLAYVLFFRLVASAGATNAALVGFLIPISATALGILVLGERFTPLQVMGALLIGLGLLIMDGRVLGKRAS